jgi:hypothetical protein
VAASNITLYGAQINPSVLDINGGNFNKSNASLISFGQNFATGTVRIYGDYQLSGSTFTLGYATPTYTGAPDANYQKKLYFGLANSAYNNGRSKIEIASGAGFQALGTSANPTLINLLSGGGTYYTFVDSGVFTVQYATFTNMDENGLEFTNSGPFSINNLYLDFSGNGVISTSTLISINGVTQSTITLSNVYYGNSRLNTYTYNFTLSGTNTGLLWTNQYYSGPLILHKNENNDPSNQILWGFHLLAPGMWEIMD